MDQALAKSEERITQTRGYRGDHCCLPIAYLAPFDLSQTVGALVEEPFDSASGNSPLLPSRL